MAYEYREISKEGSFDKGIRRYTRVYKVTTDNPALGPGQICTLTPDLLYQSWVSGTEVDLWALLKKKSAKMVETPSGHFWEVTCEYDSEPFEKGEGGTSPTGGPTDNNNQAPDVRPWQIEYGTNKTTKLLVKDLNGVEVVASNGQPYDPALEIPVCRPTITITAYKAIPADSLANVAFYAGSINLNAWQGLAAKTVMCTEYKLQSQYEQGSWWWQKTVSFEIYDEPLNPVKVLDCGTFERNSMAGIKYVPILDPTGNPVTSPVPLDGGGRKLAVAGALVYNNFKGYRETNWAGII
jgi:hypothetical protein